MEHIQAFELPGRPPIEDAAGTGACWVLVNALACDGNVTRHDMPWRWSMDSLHGDSPHHTSMTMPQPDISICIMHSQSWDPFLEPDHVPKYPFIWCQGQVCYTKSDTDNIT